MLGMSRQEMFDKVCQHLRTQKKRSFQPYFNNPTAGSCLYRGPDGLKCAIGALIPDEFDNIIYDLRLNSASVATLRKEIPELQIKEEDQDFLRSMQQMHDTYEYWDENGFNISRLKMFAIEHNLEYNE